MRTYNSSTVIPAKKHVVVNLTGITPKTKLTSLEETVTILKSERGLNLSVKTVREYCRSGKWVEQYHWVKPGKSYLINLQAVFESIVQ